MPATTPARARTKTAIETARGTPRCSSRVTGGSRAAVSNKAMKRESSSDQSWARSHSTASTANTVAMVRTGTSWRTVTGASTRCSPGSVPSTGVACTASTPSGRITIIPYARATASRPNGDRLRNGARTAAAAAPRRPRSAAALLAAGADEAVVETEQQKRRRPLPDEDGPVILLGQLEQRRQADRAQGGPVPGLLRNVVGDAEEALLRFCRRLLALGHGLRLPHVIT